jgi:hypothetical protein
MNRAHLMFSEKTGNLEIIYGAKRMLENGALRDGHRLYYVGVFA